MEENWTHRYIRQIKKVFWNILFGWSVHLYFSPKHKQDRHSSNQNYYQYQSNLIIGKCCLFQVSTLQLIWVRSIYQDEVPHCCISSPGSLQRLPPVLCQQASSCSTSASVSSGAQGSLQPGSQDHLRVCDPTGVSRCPWPGLCWCPGENLPDLAETCSGSSPKERMFSTDQERLFHSKWCQQAMLYRAGGTVLQLPGAEVCQCPQNYSGDETWRILQHRDCPGVLHQVREEVRARGREEVCHQHCGRMPGCPWQRM